MGGGRALLLERVSTGSGSAISLDQVRGSSALDGSSLGAAQLAPPSALAPGAGNTSGSGKGGGSGGSLPSSLARAGGALESRCITRSSVADEMPISERGGRCDGYCVAVTTRSDSGASLAGGME